MSECEHNSVRWLHQDKEQDCDECIRDGDPCALVVCAECGEDVDANTLTDEQERHLFRTA